MPEKSGIVLWLRVLSGPAAGATNCPHAGIAAAAINAANERKFRCTFMQTFHSWFARARPGAGDVILKSEAVHACAKV